MKKLEDRILQEGRILGNDILKVDSFLNHQVDMKLLDDMALYLKQKFSEERITKILTIEASGIPFASMCAYEFNVPLVFAKKHGARNIDPDLYTTSVHSFTYDKEYVIAVSKRYLNSEDRVLIVDDFLANGAAMNGLISIVNQANAEVAGLSAAIEKGFQGGGDELRRLGYHVESLAVIDSMDSKNIVFRKTGDD